MLTLVMKDLKNSRVSIFLFVFCIFISVLGIRMDEANFIINIVYIYFIFMVTYISVMNINMYDKKNKSEIVLNSFPINRVDVVKGKYLISIIYVLIYSISIIVFTNIFKLIGIGRGQVASIWNLTIAIIMILIYYAIYYPIYFKSEDGLAGFNQVFHLIIILFPSIVSKIGKGLEPTKINEILDIINKLDIKKVSIIVLIIAIIIYYISLQISKKIYINKEF